VTHHDEVRPVTVLFADVVGSTALAEKLPPEEAKALIGECVNQMSRAVHEYGGTVQAYMGDGICAYFGVPTAHEDDPERAARAALRIVEVVRRYARDVEHAWGIERFDVRVGINTGPAAVGVVGAVDHQTVAFGDTTNVAARLQTVAAPGTIAVGEESARRLGHRFRLEPLGELAVRGREGGVTARELAGLVLADEGAPQSPPIVGREGELNRLRVAADDLSAGRGQVVLLVGDAGIGKTRLLEELRAVVGERATWLEGQCLSYGGLPVWPFEEMLRGWLAIGEAEPEIAARTRARARLGALLGRSLGDVLAPLGGLLRIDLDPDGKPGAASGEITPDAIRRGFCGLVEALATIQPVVVAVEDMHWASPQAREMGEALLELTDRAAVMVVATLRSDSGSQGWGFRLHALGSFAHRALELGLAPLGDGDAAELVRALAAGGIDDATAGWVVARAEGNPLYLEELVRLLREDTAVERGRTWTLTVGQVTLPARLENLLVARVDTLPEDARRLAQVAAVIGRTFEVTLLERVADSDDVAGELLELVRAGIVQELRRYPELVCGFAHGLLHEAALSTLTIAHHRELTTRVADVLEELLGDRAPQEAERLAQYYIRSNRLDRAVAYLERAAAASQGDAGHATELLEAAARAAARQGDVETERRLEARISELDAGP
jgi:class 3 adenylate cyclase